MADGRSSVVPTLPAWEEKALYLGDQQRDVIWLTTSVRHTFTWSAYAPLPKDPNFRTWRVEKGRGNVALFGQQKTTLNRAIQDGWFEYGWDHPPGSRSGHGDGNCSGPCCILDEDDYDPEGEGEDEWAGYRDAPAKKKKGAKKEPPPVSFRSGDGDHLQWRFARAAFFTYFGDRAEALRMPRQDGTGSGDTEGVLRVWCAYMTRNVHVHANRSEWTCAKHIHAHTHKAVTHVATL